MKSALALKSVLFLLFIVLSAGFVAANPVITLVADQTVNEGSLLTVQVTSTPPDGTSPLITKLCQGAGCVPTTSEITIGTTATKANFTNLTLATAEFKWRPDFTQAGSYTFNLAVSDGDSTSSDAFVVTVVDVPPRLTVTSTLLAGSETQDRSNPNHDTNDRREVNVSGTVTLTNSGSEPLSGLRAAASLASGFTENDLMLNYTFPKATLAVGESLTVPVTVRMPQKLDGVNRVLQVVPVSAATLTFSATPSSTATPVTASTQISAQAANQLRIKDVKVRFDGKSESVDDGDKVNDMKAGQTVDFEIELENKFKDKEDVQIEDVEVKVISNGELDIDESEDVGDLSPEDKEVVKLSSVIDEEADDGTFDVEVTAEGVDEFGARHGEKWTIRFEVKRKSHEIAINGLTLNPPTVSCEKETRLTASIENVGRRDEQDVYVHVASTDLNFGAISEKLELDKDDEDTVSFVVPVPAAVARPATYRVNVDTYFNTGTKSNSDTALLSVAACGPAPEKKEEEKPPVGEKLPQQPPVTVVTVPPQADITPLTPPVQPAPEKKSFFETPQYLALLGLGYVVVLGGGAAVLLKLMKP